MAIEAARQLHKELQPNATILRIKDFKVPGCISFKDFSKDTGTVEVHLGATQGQSGTFSFEIVAHNAPQGSDVKVICSGVLYSAEGPFERKDISIHNHDHGNDDLLEEYAEIAEPVVFRTLEEVQLRAASATAMFSQRASDYDDFLIHAAALDAILQLPGLCSYQSNLPTPQKLVSIDEISVELMNDHQTQGTVSVGIHSQHLTGSRSQINISGPEASVQLTNVRLTNDDHSMRKPPLKSLFYRPVFMPDITSFKPKFELKLDRCLQMLLHKWPMARIGIIGYDAPTTSRVLTCFPGTEPDSRCRFSAVHVEGEKPDRASERVRYYERLPRDLKYHLILSAKDLPIRIAADYLLPQGLLCTRVPLEEDTSARPLTFVGEISVLDEEAPWYLSRKQADDVPNLSDRKRIVFASDQQKTAEIEKLMNEEGESCHHCTLNPENAQKFNLDVPKEAFDAIILDADEQSIIASWVGDDLIPWIQALMKAANSILWVSLCNESNSPFHGLAGNLLRTMQSEQPALKVAWLEVDASKESPAVLKDKIERAYESLFHEGTETRQCQVEGGTEILRYFPDDELAATVGMTGPVKSVEELGERDYEVTSTKKGEAGSLAVEIDNCKPEPKSGSVQVSVDASVIDVRDLMISHGNVSSTDNETLGTFFAGRVLSSNDAAFATHACVAGWTFSGAHRKTVSVSSSQIFSVEAEETQQHQALTALALAAHALAVVDGFARARAGDRFLIDLKGPLRDAMERLCEQHGASTLKDADSGVVPDFKVSMSPSRGLTVNNNSVNVHKYLLSDRGRTELRHHFNELSKGHLYHDHPLPLCVIPLSATLTFSSKATIPCTTLLNHTSAPSIPSPLTAHHKYSPLLSSTSAYILIGGLGGLGRYLLTWLATHGARHLYTISRSDPASPSITSAVQQTLTSINHTLPPSCSGRCTLTPLRADATSYPSLASALSTIRSHGRPIKGVINLAMLLADAPLAQMTGAQWDRAFRLKVESSWNLHLCFSPGGIITEGEEEEEEEEDLDFFLLFSSIASVLGNRNQAGYNVGNTFLNSLAEYRAHRLNLPGVSLAVGAMVDVGVLAEVEKERKGNDDDETGDRKELLGRLARSGLSALRRAHLGKIVEAGIVESLRQKKKMKRSKGKGKGEGEGRAVILTGLEMFERGPDGRLLQQMGGGTDDRGKKKKKESKGERIYWTDLPEFSQLMEYHCEADGEDDDRGGKVGLKDRVRAIGEVGKKREVVVREAFVEFLASLLGFGREVFEAGQGQGKGMGEYGLDSLGGVSCQYWFWSELGVEISVPEVFAAGGVGELIEMAIERMKT
ncbi:MAG: hypothetical protein Q9227_000749 [Pyrenula ochraceoflavens]